MRFSVILALLATSLFTRTGLGQEFEAASLHLNKSGAYASAIRRDGGRVVFDNVPLRECIAYAYGISVDREYALEGPAWMAADHYDIVATLSPGADRDQVRMMTQALLRERFGLRVHPASREVRIYALVRSQRSLQLRPPSKSDGSFTFRPGHIAAEGFSMEGFAARLSGPVFKLGIPVIDRTGLEGSFDFTLDWAPDDAVAAGGASLFTALGEQLGLKLESSKAQVEVLVVDRIERTPKGM